MRKSNNVPADCNNSLHLFIYLFIYLFHFVSLNERIIEFHLFSLDAPEDVFDNSRKYPKNKVQAFEG